MIIIFTPAETRPSEYFPSLSVVNKRAQLQSLDLQIVLEAIHCFAADALQLQCLQPARAHANSHAYAVVNNSY